MDDDDMSGWAQQELLLREQWEEQDPRDGDEDCICDEGDDDAIGSD
jgi:hypothetical protein